MNKHLLAGLLCVGTGLFGFYQSTKLASSLPEDQLNVQIRENYDSCFSLRELLSPTFRDSLESELYALESERDSLESLSTFENDKKVYSKTYQEINSFFNPSLFLFVPGILITIFGLGMESEKRKQRKSKSLS